MDWIYSSLPMIVDCIGNNFSSLLDPTQYTKVGQTGKPAQRRLVDVVDCRGLEPRGYELGVGEFVVNVGGGERVPTLTPVALTLVTQAPTH